MVQRRFAGPNPLELVENPRPPVLSHAVLGMLIFVLAEIMFFAGLISAFMIVKSAALEWPPAGQPRLPAQETLVNTGALLLSGVVLAYANRVFKRDRRAARLPFALAILLGGFFVGFQGVEWVALIRQGLTLWSSQHGAFFYLIVGLHGLHAVAALAAMLWAFHRLWVGRLAQSTFASVQVFWSFVVLVWPFLYWRVYL